MTPEDRIRAAWAAMPPTHRQEVWRQKFLTRGLNGVSFRRVDSEEFMVGHLDDDRDVIVGNIAFGDNVIVAQGALDPSLWSDE